MNWSKARYLSNALAAHGSLQLTTTSLSKVRLNAVPIPNFTSDTDPITTDSLHANAIFLQLDPLLCIHKVRNLARKMVNQETDEVKITNLTECIPRALAECTVTVQNLEILAQGDHFVQGKSIFNLKSPDLMTDEILNALEEHAYRGENRWYYLNVGLFPAIMTRKPVILGDIPEILHRYIVGNSVSVQEMRDMFAHVISVLSHHYKHSAELLTPGDALNDLYPHVFSPPRDRYVTAMMRWSEKVHGSVSAWVGVQHAEPVTELWATTPSLSEAITIPSPIPTETDSDLLEKHAILEVLLGSEVWQQPYLHTPGPYLVTPTADPQVWSHWCGVYEDQLDSVEVPDELANQAQGLISKD